MWKLSLNLINLDSRLNICIYLAWTMVEIQFESGILV